MRISDWSSDVCSSDLAGRLETADRLGDHFRRRGIHLAADRVTQLQKRPVLELADSLLADAEFTPEFLERRALLAEAALANDRLLTRAQHFQGLARTSSGEGKRGAVQVKLGGGH